MATVVEFVAVKALVSTVFNTSTFSHAESKELPGGAPGRAPGPEPDSSSY
jgi:hypothetical protein